MEQLFIDLPHQTSINKQNDHLHVISNAGDKIMTIYDFIGMVVDGEFIVRNMDGSIAFLSGQTHPSALHNAIPRCKNLGTQLTQAQAAEIASGNFSGLFNGDFWFINNINWRIVHVDYWLNTGDTPCTKHHLVIVPDTGLYSAQMHNTPSGGYVGDTENNTTEGGYVGSDMYKTGLNTAKTMAAEAFGSAHILTHRELLVNAVSKGSPSAGAWYDSTVELMSEIMVYGSRHHAPGGDGVTVPYNYTIDKTQLAFFALCPEFITNRAETWLRDVVSGVHFARILSYGHSGRSHSSDALLVRPDFGIC